MFADLIEQLAEALNETVKKDLTGYRKTLVQKGRQVLALHPGMVSKKKLKKWGVIPTWQERQQEKSRRRYDLLMAKDRRDKAAAAAKKDGGASR